MKPIQALRFPVLKEHDFSRAEGFWAAQRLGPRRACSWLAGVERFSAAVSAHHAGTASAAVGNRGRAALQGRDRRNKLGRALAPALRRAIQSLVVIAAAFLFLSATPPNTDARFKDLGHRLMCTCGCGQILLECNHVGCQSSDKMRNELQAALDRGDNDDLVLQDFVQEYGPTVIAAPTATGFNKVAWIMPFVALAVGIAFVTWVVRAWKHRPEPVLADGITIPQGDELDRFRAQARKETDV